MRPEHVTMALAHSTPPAFSCASGLCGLLLVVQQIAAVEQKFVQIPVI